MKSKIRPFLAFIVGLLWLAMVGCVASDRVVSAIGYTAGLLITPFLLVYYSMRSFVAAPKWAYSFLLAWLLTVPITLYFGEASQWGTIAGLIGGALATAFSVYVLGQSRSHSFERQP